MLEDTFSNIAPGMWHFSYQEQFWHAARHIADAVTIIEVYTVASVGPTTEGDPVLPTLRGVSGDVVTVYAY